MARSSCSAGGRCKCLSEVNLKISSHSLSDFRNELKWSPSYSSFTRYICNHGEYNYLRSKRTCRRQSHMLRVLSHLMSRYWFILSGKKKKISLTLFWWPCGLTRNTSHCSGLVPLQVPMSETFTGWLNSKAVCLLHRHREVTGFAAVPNLRVKKSCWACKLDIPHLCDWGKRTVSSRRQWELVSLSQNHNSKKRRQSLHRFIFQSSNTLKFNKHSSK